MSVETQTARFRDQVYADRARLINALRAETYDEGYILYPGGEGEEGDLIIKDAFQEQLSEPITDFIRRLQEQWWVYRRSRNGVDALRAFYCRYLPEVGFDWLVEFNQDGIVCCWRRDRRQRSWRLEIPEDEGMFRDQLGAFFSARAGWRWLLESHRAEGRLVATEVQPGYIIGARKGVPGDPDPEAREDPELEEAFSRWDISRYDTLEFLGGAAAEAYPFHEERYDAWLGEASDLVARGEVEIFALAESNQFVEAIEELACGRGVGIDWIDIDDDPHAELYHGPLRLTIHFAYGYLRAIHTGLSFPEGAKRFYGPAIDQLEDAGDLLAIAERRLKGYEISVEERQVLVIRQSAGEPPLGRWGLMSLAGSHAFRGEEGEDAFLRFLGFDPESGRFEAAARPLDRCPITGGPARLTKLIRPKALLGFDYKLLAGVDLGEHFVYYALEGETHTIPLNADRALEELETAYQDQLPEARTQLQAVVEIEGGVLYIGPDVGSLILEPGRVRSLIRDPQQFGGRCVAYAFFPDVLMLSAAPLLKAQREAARMRAFEITLKHAPRRLWALERVAQIDLEVDAVGAVVWPQ